MTNDLVVYQPNSLDLAQHIRKLQTPIKSLNPETRIVSGNDMYAGGIIKIHFDESGISGVPYVRFLQATGTREKSEPSLLDRLSTTIFGTLEINDNDLVGHDNRKYKEQWAIGSEVGDYITTLFRLERYTGVFKRTDFPEKLKMRIVNQLNLLLSNELMEKLFAPLSQPLIQLYREMARF